MTVSNCLAPYVRSFFEDHPICHRNASSHTVQSYRDGVKLLLLFSRLGKISVRIPSFCNSLPAFCTLGTLSRYAQE